MSVDVSPEELQDKRRASLERIEKLAWWLDDAFRIPGTNRRVGIDGLVGLVPVAGDLVTTGMSSLLIAEAYRLGAPKRVWMRMSANVGADFLIGLVPVVGDITDMVWKANRRNERIMRRWLQDATVDESEPQARENNSAGGSAPR